MLRFQRLPDMSLQPQANASPQRVAVVGAGFFSQFHLAGWAEVPGVEVVGLCDVDTDKARTLASQFGISKTYPNLNELLHDAQPDLVDVVLPPAAQAPVLTRLFETGLPVICQKPFGTSYAQALEFMSQAKANQTKLVVHENFRFMPWYRELRRCIDAGLLGDLYGVSFRLRPGDGQGPRAYLDRQPYFQTMPRLLVAETAIHLIDTFRFLLGEVVAVYARLRQLNPVIQGEDAALITFEFQGGAAGLFDGNRLASHQANNPRRTMGEMWLEGSKGVMRLDGEARLWWAPHQGVEAEHAYDRGPATGFGGGACGALQRHVIEGLANQTPLENTAQDYLQNLLIQEAVYASHASGKRIEIAKFSPTAAPWQPLFA